MRFFTFALHVLPACCLCSCNEPTTEADCFDLLEGDTTTVLVVREDSITTYERRDGNDIAQPESAPGRRVEEGFKYPNGTLLLIDEETLTWPEESLLPSAVFSSCDCPT